MLTACASCEFIYGPGHVAAPCRHQAPAGHAPPPAPGYVTAPELAPLLVARPVSTAAADALADASREVEARLRERCARCGLTVR